MCFATGISVFLLPTLTYRTLHKHYNAIHVEISEFSLIQAVSEGGKERERGVSIRYKSTSLHDGAMWKACVYVQFRIAAILPQMLRHDERCTNTIETRRKYTKPHPTTPDHAMLDLAQGKADGCSTTHTTQK